MVEDCHSFSALKSSKVVKKTTENVSLILSRLFDLKRTQQKDEGEQILEYTRPTYMVELPEPQITLPREKPAPKPKPPTKWERYRLEKGLPARKKRSRLVFDPITKDWVPRHGMGSIKKIKDKSQWLIDKDVNKETGVDPYTQKSQRKKLESEKEKLR